MASLDRGRPIRWDTHDAGTIHDGDANDRVRVCARRARSIPAALALAIFCEVAAATSVCVRSRPTAIEYDILHAHVNADANANAVQLPAVRITPQAIRRLRAQRTRAAVIAV
eukprot:CAMPEP_0183347590 /NCGR_PEP_ID=MMETSP0164_2-20130417/12373_1 /TAXON_ID=221442 /ORGANISM="Coccolithus pelagicus ssp braarudi, Strain PLY182g" /LENGTH=111 /DNA_ID=CAMNT_0025519043 /DNA_START=493 /DNA_END=825 /DNA_ORIENTATION=+